MKRTVANRIASLLVAIRNCERSGNLEWRTKHARTLVDLIKDHMPFGSGIDNGTQITFERSGDTRLTFSCGFHHMNEDGYYDGWTQHVVTARPCFTYGMQIKISGPDRNGIKDYLAEVFQQALTKEIEA